MFKTAGKLLAVVLVLSATPTTASVVLFGPSTPEPLPVEEALSRLPGWLSEEAFFEAVNSRNAAGFEIAGQGGTQAMMVSIRISVPGAPPAAGQTPPPFDPSGTFDVDSFFDINTEINPAGQPPGSTIPDDEFNDLVRDITNPTPPNFNPPPLFLNEVPTIPGGAAVNVDNYRLREIHQEIIQQEMRDNFLLGGGLDVQPGGVAAPSVEDFFDVTYPGGIFGTGPGGSGASSSGSGAGTGSGAGSATSGTTGGSSSGSGAAAAGNPSTTGGAPADSALDDASPGLNFMDTLEDNVPDEFKSNFTAFQELLGLSSTTGGEVQVPPDYPGTYIEQSVVNAECGANATTPTCLALGGVNDAIGGLMDVCTANMDPCERLSPLEGLGLHEAGSYLVVIDTWAASDPPNGDYLLTIQVDETLTAGCQGASTEFCDAFGGFTDSLDEFNDLCADSPEPVCSADLGALGDSSLEVLEGSLEAADDAVDWYSFTLSTDALVTLETLPPPESLDTEVWLFENNNDCVLNVPTCDLAAVVPAELQDDPNLELAAGTYYLLVDAWSECSSQQLECLNLFGTAEPGDEFLIGLDLSPDINLPGTDYDYTLTVDIEAARQLCNPNVLGEGCAPLGDAFGAMSEFNDACDVFLTSACAFNGANSFSDEEMGWLDDFGSEFAFDNTDGVGDDIDDVTDWYAFTLDAGSIVTIEPFTTTAPPDCPPAGCSVLFDANTFGVCGVDNADPNCGAANAVVQATLNANLECGGSSEGICPQLLQPGEYLLTVNSFPALSNAGGYDYELTVNVDPVVVSPCNSAAGVPGCGAAAELGAAYQNYLLGCDQNPTNACTQGATALDLDDFDFAVNSETGLLTPVAGTTDNTVASGGREVTYVPGDASNIDFRETGDSTGIFTVSDEYNAGFSPWDGDMLPGVFGELPAGATVVHDGARVRVSPGNPAHFLVRTDDGKVFLIDSTKQIVTDTTTEYDRHELTVSESASDDSKVVLTGGDGYRVVLPRGDATVININNTPNAIASTPAEIADATAGTGAELVGMATASGGSTGEVFNFNIFNMGKSSTTIIEGDVVLEALTDEEAAETRNLMAGLMSAANSVANGPGTAYCLEQDKAVPTTAQLFRFASAGKQQEFDFGRQIVTGGRAVTDAGSLNPDTSDLTAYSDSIIQWAIWTVGKGYDKEAFGESFVDTTRKAIENGGNQWSQPIEDAVRSLIDNRWNDIQQVLDASGNPTVNNDAPVAHNTAPAWTLLLAAVALITATRYRRAV